MKNPIALSLVLTSLAAATVSSPLPEDTNGDEHVIVKGGHRAVVVEFEEDAGPGEGNTKVSILPPHTSHKSEEGISGAAGQDSKEIHGPRELICDAFGKCKHKIAGALSRAKEKTLDAEEGIKEKVGEAIDKSKAAVDRTAHKAAEFGGDVKEEESAKESVEETAARGKRKVEEAGEDIKWKAETAKDEAEEKVQKKKKDLTDIMRRGKEVVVDSIGYVGSPETVGKAAGVVEMVGAAVAYGVSVWVTFVMSNVLAGALPRQQFGVVQSKVYPVYFRVMVGSIGLAELGHLAGRARSDRAWRTQGFNLLGSGLLVLANLLVLEPRATKVMFQRMKLEKEEGRGRDSVTTPRARMVDTVLTDIAGPIRTPTTATTTITTNAPPPAAPEKREKDEATINRTKMGKLERRLKRLNSYSSLLNIMTLMGLTWHLLSLGQRLHVST